MEATARKYDVLREKNIHIDNEKALVNTRVRRISKSKNKMRALRKRAFVIFSIGMVFLASIIILNGYANIAQMKVEISNLETEMGNLNKTKQSLTGRIEELKSTSKVTEEAKYKLGMVYPEESQVVYFTLNSEDGVEEPKDGLLDKVITAIKSFNSSF